MFAPIFLRKKNYKSPELSKGENDVRSRKQEENLSFNNNNNDTKSALILILDYIHYLLRCWVRNCTKQILYFGQIIYNCGLLAKVGIKALEVGQLNSSTKLISLFIAKFHKHIV